MAVHSPYTMVLNFNLFSGLCDKKEVSNKKKPSLFIKVTSNRHDHLFAGAWPQDLCMLDKLLTAELHP